MPCTDERRAQTAPRRRMLGALGVLGGGALLALGGCALPPLRRAPAPAAAPASVPASVPAPLPSSVPAPVPAPPAAASPPPPPRTPAAAPPAPSAPPPPAVAAPTPLPPRPPRYVALGPAPAPNNFAELQLQFARRLVAAHPDTSYTERAPDRLLAIPVLEVELNGDGSVRRVQVLRRPSTGDESIALAVAAVHRAAPYGNLSRLPRPWRLTEVFLFDDRMRFKPRTLDR